MIVVIVMIDKHNREINYLRISITDRCNLRCVYCMPKEGVSFLGHKDILSYEEMLRIVGAAVKTGIVKVRVTGGEPLVRRGVTDFLVSLTKLVGLKDISLTTNGILLEDYAEEIFNAGIKRINISLDSLSPDKYREITRGGDLSRVIRGIQKAHAIGFSPIKINVVAIKGFNDDEIIDFAKFTIDKPYQIRFIEFMPVGSSALENNLRYLSNDEIIQNISRFTPLEPVIPTRLNKIDGPASLYTLKGAKGRVGFISAISHEFCSSCNRLRLTADGHLRACLLSDEPTTDLKTPMRNGCSNYELEALIRELISKKPSGHRINSKQAPRRKCVTNMSSIGG
ncbi:MAG: GTP 3',8-cyclase MoaA [Thermodesulfobacteriota bacterium]|nr:GTP 3',8-cyclase MoaA [Thermodesulfobacteriota bacterium]